MVWHRALDLDALQGRDGDRALHDVQVFDGAAQNGGLLHAIEIHADDEEYPLDRVLVGLEHLGLEQTASLVRAAASRYAALDPDDLDAAEALEEEVEPSYSLGDDDLMAALDRTLAAEPDAFAPEDELPVGDADRTTVDRPGGPAGLLRRWRSALGGR